MLDERDGARRGRLPRAAHAARPRRRAVRARVRRAAARALLRGGDRRALRERPPRTRARAGDLALDRAAGCSPIRSSSTSFDLLRGLDFRGSWFCVGYSRAAMPSGVRGDERPDSTSDRRASGVPLACARPRCCAPWWAPGSARRSRSRPTPSRSSSPSRCSPATVRSTLAELAELGLVAKPHALGGPLPDRGRPALLRAPTCSAPRRSAATRCATSPRTSRRRSAAALPSRPRALLSERTRQLGFVLAPRLADVMLRHVSLVRLSSERVLAVLVTRDGRHAPPRASTTPARSDQAELDRMAATLSRAPRSAARCARRASGCSPSRRALRREADRCASARSALARTAPARRRGRPRDRDAPRGPRPARVPGPGAPPRALPRDRRARAADRGRRRGARPERRDACASAPSLGEPALRHCALVAAP